MAVVFPPELAGLLKALSGMDPPEANEDSLRAVGDMYDASAADLIELKSLVVELVNEIRSNFEGDAADAFIETMEKYISGDDYLGAAATGARELGQFARSVALQVEYMKWMMIAIVAWLAAELAFLAATAWFNWSAPLEMMLARMMANFALKQIVAKVLARSSCRSASASPWAWRWTRSSRRSSSARATGTSGTPN